MANCGQLLLVACVLVAVVYAQPTLNASKLSLPYRNWHYYIGAHDGFVVPPNAGDFPGQSLTDTAIVFLKTPEDKLPGLWRMTYLFFNNTPGAYGYEAALATSADLLNWEFGRGGQNGLVFPRSPDPDAFDYGGVTLGGLHFQNSSLKSPRTLRKTAGSYHALYGCYPSRAGYEAGAGGEGIAESRDGVTWSRVSSTVPVLSGGSPALKNWEKEVVYQPFLLEHNGTLWDFYNAKGLNQYGKDSEESGLATLPAAALPGIDGNTSQWARNPASPVLPSGPPGSVDTYQAADPKVFWDQDQGVWVMFYFGNGDGTHGHAAICVAFSNDLITWVKDPKPLYAAGGHPSGIDQEHAHKISIIYDAAGVGYLYYTAVGPKGRGIALLTSKPMV